MMRWIVVSSMRFRLAVVAFAAAVIYFGAGYLEDMPVDVLPEFTPPYVEIQTEALGLSAAEVEQLITVPLEADLLNGVPWLDSIRSESIPGLSSIELVFEPGTDLMKARQMVQERMTQAHALPHVSQPPAMLQPLSSTNRLMMIGLSSKKLSLIEMSVLARWTLRPRLMGVPGVANVAIWGQRERQLQVQVNPEQLKEKGVTLQQVIKTTGNALWVSPLTFLESSTPGTGGFIDTPNQRLGVRHISPISSHDDLAQVTVENSKLRLGDVANVVEDHQPLIGDALINDASSLLLVVEKFPGANTLEVTEEVQEALEALAPGLSGMEIDSKVFRPATYIEKSIYNVSKSVIIGGVFMVLVIGLSLYNWRAALICLMVIPVSVIVAASVLYLRGATLNVMVLAGLVVALGALIDDAIIDVENIMRRLRQHRKERNGRSTARVVFDAVVETRKGIGYATLIILLVVSPLFFINGLFGALLRPLAVSYALAIAASLLVALTVTPAMAVLLLSGASAYRRETSAMRSLKRSFQTMLSRALRQPRLVYLAVGTVALAGIAALPLLRNESILPTFKETNLLIRLDGAPGTSRPEMSRIAAKATSELRKLPGVLNVGAHVGRAIMSDQVAGINVGELWVSIDSTADYHATVAAIKEVIDGYPGLDCDVTTYAKERVAETLQREDDPIVVRVYGEDLKVLRTKAAEIKDAIAKINGIDNARVEVQVEEPTVEIEVNLEAAKRHGIKPGDVRRASATLLSGIEVGSLFEEQKVFQVVVWGAPSVRHSLTSIRELMIDTPSGGHVLLGEVADVRIVSAPNVVKRDAVSRYVDVAANVEGRKVSAAADDVKQRIQQIAFPREYHAELLSDYARNEAAQGRTAGLAIAAILGIYLVLQAAFKSWRLAAVTAIALPMALVGGILTLLISGGTASLGSWIGLVAVFGIGIRNCIMLVNRYRDLEHQEREPFGPGLVMRGTRERLAPILITAVSVSAAFLPVLIMGGVAGQEILQPMAVVIFGGLVTSTLLNLFVVPVLYLQFGASREPDLELTFTDEVHHEESLDLVPIGHELNKVKTT